MTKKETDIKEVVADKPKVKRGRRTKKEIEEAKAAAEAALLNSTVEGSENVVLKMEEIEKPPPKKRGRKPNGGKIVMDPEKTTPVLNTKPNVILHLKCFVKDLLSEGHHEPDFSKANVNSYDENKPSYHMLSNTQSVDNLSNYQQLLSETENNIIEKKFAVNDPCQKSENICNNVEPEHTSMKETWKKLKNLEQLLHVNSVPDSKSACFWCTYDFDNPPIYIPKFLMKDTYHVYGCFCSPECAVGHLMNETLDSSCKFERYSLLNNLYNRVFEYKKNIKPAPNPHYFLDRFCGNLTIQEYRQLLKSDRLFLIVDKPLTRVLPELHEDNDEFIINNKIIPTSSNYNLKKMGRVEPVKLSGGVTTQSATSSGNNFGIFSMVTNK